MSKPEIDPEIDIDLSDSESENESVVSSENPEDIPKNPEDIEDFSDVDEEDVEDDEEDDDEEDDDEEDDVNDEDEKKKGISNIKPKITITDNEYSDEDDEDDEDEDEDYLQKFDKNVRSDIISEYHPELIQHNDEEVETLCIIVRDSDGNIIDPLHKTVPFITKYEKARILGERAKQINSGAKLFIKTEKTMIDGYLIALREFEEKKIPFIIRRPLPNGGSEYWKMADLEIID